MAEYDPTQLHKNARTLVRFCAAVRPHEHVLLIFDDSTLEIKEYLTEAASEASSSVEVVSIELAQMHGTEPPAPVVESMQRADVILALTKYSLAHTQARFAATNRGARYLSLPQYGLAQLSRRSFNVDFATWAQKGRILKTILDAGKQAHITTHAGTNLTLSLESRVANWAPGFCDEPGMLGSPPDIETNIAPIERKSSGTLVVDGSIPCEALGLLAGTVTVTVVDGSIHTISETAEGIKLARLFDKTQDPKHRVLAEFGIGLNPEARLCGLMLEDEGCLGTVHFGFGSNATIGGQNSTSFHLDMVIRKPTVEVDGRLIIEEGTLLL